MKKLLVLLALCMVLSIVMVACEEPVTPPAETTQGTTTDAPTTDAPTTDAPTTQEPTTEEITTDPGTTETDTTTPPETSTEETTTPPPPPADPVTTCLSFDELSMITDGNAVGFFTPGQSASWDKIANVEDYNVDTIKVWGWVGFFAETIGEFGYQIGDAEPVFDAAFVHATEDAVIAAASNSGAKSASRFAIMIPVEYVSGEEITVKALARDAAGTIETLVEFKLTKPVNPNAPVFFATAAELAGTIAGSPDVVSAEMSADGNYVTINTADVDNNTFHDPYYQLPMLNGKATVANFVAIKYRTSVAGARSEIFVGSGAGPAGGDDNYAFDVVTDGKWNLAIIDLANTPAVVDGVINFLRWDPYVGNEATATTDMAYIGLFNTAEAALAYDAQFKGVLIDTLNVPTSAWTVTGHREGVQDSSDPMVSAGGVEAGALLHQGYIYLGDINLAEMSKVVIYYGVDGSQTTIDLHAASANNRILLTSADQAMTNSPTEDVILAANTYTELGWAVKPLEIDLTGVDYNGPVYVTYDTLPGTFFLISSVEFTYDPNYVEPEAPVEVPEHTDQEVIIGERNPAGAPYMGAGDKKMGQKLPLGETILKQITIKDLATYADGNTNTWTFKIWAWNTDYATTVAAAPLYEVAGENHNDNATFVLDIPVELLITGDVYYELEYLTGSGGFTGWPANEILIPGVETYIAGALKEGTYASSVVVGIEITEPENPDPENPDPENPDPEVILSTDKTTYTVGESIMVTAIGGGTDWVGIAKKGETSSMRWWYIDPVDGYVSVGSGVPFDAVNGETNYNVEEPLTAGEYVIVIIPNDQPFASGDFKATVEITITE